MQRCEPARPAAASRRRFLFLAAPPVLRLPGAFAFDVGCELVLAHGLGFRVAPADVSSSVQGAVAAKATFATGTIAEYGSVSLPTSRTVSCSTRCP